MKNLTKTLMILMLSGLFAQSALAQDGAAGAALKQIADIVASINHFPSDADKAALAEISGNMELPEQLRGMADAVAGISHAASAEGKALMAEIQSGAAPDSAKQLAGIISELNHVPSADAKATLAQLFP